MKNSFNLRLDQELIDDIKKVSKIYDESMSELIREGIQMALEKRKNSIFYRLNSITEYVDEEEEAEILEALSSLTDDDLTIERSETVEV
ncbi:MAG: hypothetical protein ACRCXX_09190 [Cetobacterium sp.]|uniref:hypothetical protein n=1 Tax=unclassified Cetobacterium TaxID=2630983 RepID=UPI0006484766|nr:hypothetical protein [Cetobacterium sp. ZOR0034]